MERKSVSFLTLFLLVALAGVALANETTTEESEQPEPLIRCIQPYEMYDECGPACGSLTCENYDRDDIPCTKQCVQGCFCHSGFVRNKAGNCVRPTRCRRS